MRMGAFAGRRGGGVSDPSPERSERDVYRSVVLRLAGLTALLLILSQGVLSFLLARTFEDTLLPEVRRKAEVAGELVAEQIGYAVSLGIPLRSLVEMDEFLDGVLADNEDFRYVAVLDPNDVELYARGTLSESTRDAADSELTVPIVLDNGRRVASLRVQVQEGTVRSELAALRLDIGTVLLVTLLIGIELLVALVVVRISGPIRLADRLLALSARGDFSSRFGVRHRDEVGRFGQLINAALHRINAAFAELVEEAEDAHEVQLDRGVQQRIRDVVSDIRTRFHFATPGSENTLVSRSPMDVRIPLFLFMLAQEISRPFLPLFFDEIYTPIFGLSRDVTIGLPITAFMTMVLVSIPIAGALTDRIAPRGMFVAGIVPSVVGHVGTAFATSLVQGIMWWTIAGLGYGIIFISAQAYVAQHTEQTSRATGMAGFLGAVFAAFVCGPAIGGMLADRLGYQDTLLVAAALAAVSAAAALVTIDPGGVRRLDGPRGGMRGWLRLLAHREFLIVTVLSALPSKLVLGGLFFYLVPRYLAELGNVQSNVGRVMMAYGIACVLVTPLVARRLDRVRRPRVLMVAGGCVIGVGCALPALTDATGLVLAAVAVMGAGHAMVTVPQLAVIQEIAQDASRELGLGPGAIVGMFRTLERVGTAAGAMLVGAAVAALTYGDAMLAVGALVLVCTVLYVAAGGAARRALGVPA